MTDALDRPIIALALETRVPSGRSIWNLYTAAGALIGWAIDLPSPLVASPGCWQYRTGDHLAVDYASPFQALRLDQQ